MQGGSAPPQPGVEIPTGAFVAKITNDAREEEMEENMQQVCASRNGLRIGLTRGGFHYPIYVLLQDLMLYAKLLCTLFEG